MDHKSESKNEDFIGTNGYEVDAKGRRFSLQQGQYTDEKGRRFSGYDDAGRRISVVDDVFGEIKEGGPNYRDVCVLLRAVNTYADLR